MSHFLFFNDDIISSLKNLRAIYRTAYFEANRKTEVNRNKAQVFHLTDNLTFYYTVSCKEVSQSKVRIRAYFKDFSTRQILPETVKSAKLTALGKVDYWIKEVYAFQYILQSEKALFALRDTYTKNNTPTDMTCSTFMFLYYPQLKTNEKQFLIYKNLFFSNIGSLPIIHVTDRILREYVISQYYNNESVSLRSALTFLNQVFDTAYKIGYCNQNPVLPVISEFSSRNEDLLDVRNALSKKFFYEDELRQIVKQASRLDIPYRIGIMLRLTTALPPSILCALKWNDYIKTCIDDRTFYRITVRRWIDNSGETFHALKKRDDARSIPLPSAVSELLNKEKERQLHSLANGNEDYLGECSIVSGTDHILNGQFMALAPRKLYNSHRKLLKKICANENIITVPTDENDLFESDFNSYQGDIFRTNYSHYATAVSNALTNEEISFILANKKPNTISDRYIDFNNEFSQYKLYLKCEQIYKVMMNE